MAKNYSIIQHDQHGFDHENHAKNHEKMVRINFEVPKELRNAFKSKVAQQGKKVKDVLAEFMADYVNDDR